MTGVATAILAYLAGLAVSLTLAVRRGGAAAPSFTAIGACLMPLAVPVALTTVRRPSHARAVWPTF